MRLFQMAAIAAAASAVALGKFVSSKVADLHPVENFQVQHLHEKSVHLGGVRADGVHQPYPDFVKVSFNVPSLERSFEFDMRVMNEIFDSAASVAFDHGDAGRVEKAHRITTYTSETDAEHGYATATLHDDGTASMTIFGQDARSSFQIAPVHMHEEHMDADSYSRLQESHKMVLHTLGSLGDASNELNVELVSKQGAGEGASSERLVSSSARHLLQRFPTVAERWAGCHGGSATDEFVFKLGLAVDVGYYKQASRNGGNVMDNLAQIVATMNQVYRPELGVIIQLGETEVKTTLTNGEAWNQDRGNFRTCALGIEGALEQFDAWRTSTRRSSTMGAWHLLTDCYPPPGTVGLAYVGSVCRAFGSNVGVNTFSGTQTWLTIAHELGHNFGADHSFELGQGRTGGIMDYGNGLLNGVYSFNRRFREADICPTIQNARRSRQSIANCFAPSTGVSTPAPFTGNWQVTQWGQCSATCGLQGVRTRTVVCTNPAGQSVDASTCDPTKRPLAQEACNRVTCSSLPPTATATTQAPVATGSGTTVPPTTSIGGFPIPQCTCGDWSAYSTCDAASNTRTRSRICSPSLVCFFLGEATEETQVCNPGTVPATQQVILQINRPFSSIGNVESFKTQIEAQLPALLGMPNNVVKVTGIEDAGNGSIKVTFYVLGRLSQDVMMPLSEATPLALFGFGSNSNSKFKVVPPPIVVAAAEMNPELYPLGGNVVNARAATETDFSTEPVSDPSTGGETAAPESDSGKSKDNTKLILGVGITGGLIGAGLAAAVAVVIVRRQRKDKARVVLLSTHASEVSKPL